MLLLTPSAGQVSDRLSILKLKIEAAKEKSLRWDHFNDERIGLISYAEMEYPVKKNLELRMGQLVDMLNQANKELWVLEDKMRALPDYSGMDFDQVHECAMLGKMIACQNDLRATAVKGISQLFDHDYVQEKIYEQSTI